MKFKTPFIIIITIFFTYHFSFAQTATTSLKITNTENKETTFSSADLQSLPQTTLKVEGEDGMMHTYKGIDIITLLSKAGVAFGKEARRQTIISYMLIKAADKYSVVYALAEIDTFMSAKKMILAATKDGQPLPVNFAPLQIITTGEKKHARLIRQVTEIYIKKVE
jgi:hypothetical protein